MKYLVNRETKEHMIYRGIVPSENWDFFESDADGWIICEYDDDGEIINPEFANAPDDSWWFCDSRNKCHVVMIKSEIWFRPERVARVWHPDEVVK